MNIKFIKPLMLVAVATLFMTSACSDIKTKSITPEGRLDVLGPTPQFDNDEPTSDWVLIGTSAANNITTNPIKGIPGIGITSADDALLAVRRVNAMVLATPYLSWAWNMTDHGDGLHPVRIIVGFKRLDEKDDDGFFSLAKIGLRSSDLPKHSRALSIVWGDSALGRGSMRMALSSAGDVAAPLYMPRGGRENTNKWWMETVDLSEIYQKAWPGESQRDLAISFIGIAASPDKPGHRGRISGIVLSR